MVAVAKRFERGPVKSRVGAFPDVLSTGALKMTDRKMTDRDIAGDGKCRTGIRRTKV